MNSTPLLAPRLLLATADRELGRQIAEILLGQPCSIQTAGDGVEALKILLDTSPPEIALLDTSLPGQSGIDLAAEVRRRPGAKQTWIILLSNSAEPATVAAAADAGVDDLLLCPVREADLRVRLCVARRVQELASQFDAHSRTDRFSDSRDLLTGLWNRESLLRLLFPETDRVQRMGTPLSLLLLDLDHFARVNSDYGYGIADKILQEVASRLRRYMRSYDLIGRCGKDQFLIALPGCNSAQALHLASRIRTILLHRPFTAGRDLVTLTASIGLTQSRGRSPLVVLREAGRALANAKLEGRNCEREFAAPQANPEQLRESQSA